MDHLDSEWDEIFSIYVTKIIIYLGKRVMKVSIPAI